MNVAELVYGKSTHYLMIYLLILMHHALSGIKDNLVIYTSEDLKEPWL